MKVIVVPNGQPKKPQPFSDVAWPGQTAANATSKPILPAQRPSHIDQTVNSRPNKDLEVQVEAVVLRSMPNRILLDAEEDVASDELADKSSYTPSVAAEHLPLKQAEIPSAFALPKKTEIQADTIAKKEAPEQPKLSQRPKKIPRSLSRKIIIGVLCAAVVAAVVYNVVLIQEYLSLK